MCLTDAMCLTDIDENAAGRCQRHAVSAGCSGNFERRIGIGSRVNVTRRATERTLPGHHSHWFRKASLVRRLKNLMSQLDIGALPLRMQ